MLSTIIISSIVAIVFVAIIVSMIKNRKKGGCSCGCTGCSLKGSCHK